MALFKISKGSKSNLPATLTEGYCWYTFEDSKFYIDFKDENGVLTRKALSAENAETICGMSLEELKNEIATQDAVILHEAQTYTDNALAQAKENGDLKGEKGEDGADGISATHSWNGTTLTITSASGTSSADLKGEKGDQGEPGTDGEKGADGEKGEDGYTPVRGTDYWTDADKAEMTSYIDEKIASMITTETWTFTLEDGSTVEKEVCVL